MWTRYHTVSSYAIVRIKTIPLPETHWNKIEILAADWTSVVAIWIVQCPSVLVSYLQAYFLEPWESTPGIMTQGKKENR